MQLCQHSSCLHIHKFYLVQWRQKKSTVGVGWEPLSDCVDNTYRKSHSHTFPNIFPAPAYEVAIRSVAVTSIKNNRNSTRPRPWANLHKQQQQSMSYKPIGERPMTPIARPRYLRSRPQLHMQNGSREPNHANFRDVSSSVGWD